MIAFLFALFVVDGITGTCYAGISGQVTDGAPKRLPIPFANIFLRTVEGVQTSKILADGFGRFSFDCLGEGAYFLQVTLEGFYPVEVGPIRYKPGDNVTINVTLNLDTRSAKAFQLETTLVVEVRNRRAGTVVEGTEINIARVGGSDSAPIRVATDRCGVSMTGVTDGTYEITVRDASDRVISKRIRVRGEKEKRIVFEL